MTVSTTISHVAVVVTGADTAIATTFPFFDAVDLLVTQRVTATGVDTTMVLGTHYSVSGGGGSDGTVTVIAGVTNFTTAMTWTIERITPKTQATDYVEGDSFPAESHETALDKLTHLAQERDTDVGRTIKIPLSDPAGLTVELPNSVTRAEKFLNFDSSGNVTVTDTVLADTAVVSAFGETLINTADKDAARDVLGVETDIEASRPGSATAGDMYFSTDTGRAYIWNGSIWVEIGPDLIARNANHLINGQFLVNTLEENAGFNRSVFSSAVADVESIYDGWRFYEASASIGGIDQLRAMDGDDLPTGYIGGIALTHATIDVQWGIAAMVDSERTSILRDSGTCSLRFRAKRTSGSTFLRLRAAVIEWTGTRDAMTADPVATGNAQGTNPTLAASFAYANTPTAHHAIDGTWQTFTIEDITISGSANNLLVFIWADVGTNPSTSTDVVAISGVELLDVGTFVQPEYRTAQDDRLACARHYFAVSGSTTNAQITTSFHAGAAVAYLFIFRSPVEMYDGATADSRGKIVQYGGSWAGGAAETNVDTLTFSFTRGSIRLTVTPDGAGFTQFGNSSSLLARLEIDGWEN